MTNGTYGIELRTFLPPLRGSALLVVFLGVPLRSTPSCVPAPLRGGGLERIQYTVWRNADGASEARDRSGHCRYSRAALTPVRGGRPRQRRRACFAAMPTACRGRGPRWGGGLGLSAGGFSGLPNESAGGELNVSLKDDGREHDQACVCRFAPEGHWRVAWGGAKRNPKTTQPVTWSPGEGRRQKRPNPCKI